MRLGLFTDAAFRSAGGRVYANDELLGFGTFAAAVGERLEGLVVIARATDDAAATPYELPGKIELASLPHYRSLRDLPGLVRSLPATVSALWRALSQVDTVWVSASNPIGVILMAFAALRRRRIVVLVRQDSMAYFRSRLPGRGWAPLLLPLYFVDLIYRIVGRRARVTVVGAQIADRYGAPRPNLHQMTVSLMKESEVVEAPPQRDWSREVRLLAVGRIEPEKNPPLLVEMLAALNEGEGRFRLTWAGTGRLSSELRERAEELGVSELLELPGFVPFGPPLLELYDGSHAFVHSALTEGVPGVLSEAMARGLPIIATDVGGIGEATDSGAAALLVPPRDAAALTDAVLELQADPGLRRRIALRGLELARTNTIESQSAAAAGFLAGG